METHRNDGDLEKTKKKDRNYIQGEDLRTKKTKINAEHGKGKHPADGASEMLIQENQMDQDDQDGSSILYGQDQLQDHSHSIIEKKSQPTGSPEHNKLSVDPQKLKPSKTVNLELMEQKANLSDQVKEQLKKNTAKEKKLK